MASGDGRRSLAHLADKFNTAPPPGYVAGRGRGAMGFSKPPPPEEGENRVRVSRASKREFGFIYLRALRTGARALSLERGSLLDIILRLKEDDR